MDRLARFRCEHARRIGARRPRQHRTSFTAVVRQDRFPLKRDRDKGKPGESRGRKATRLRRPRTPAGATLVGPPNESSEVSRMRRHTRSGAAYTVVLTLLATAC